MQEARFRLSNGFPLSPKVMAIIPVPYGSKYYSKVLEVDGEFMTPQRPLDVIKKSCTFYASSYIGRKEGTKALTGFTHKLPIVIDHIQRIYVFPTVSPSNSDCIWININHVERFEEPFKGVTEVIFKNGKSITVAVSLYSMNKQLYRAYVLAAKVDAYHEQIEKRRIEYNRSAENPNDYKVEI